MFTSIKNKLRLKKKPEDEENALSNTHTKESDTPTSSTQDSANKKPLKFYQGGVRERYKPVVKWIGRLGFTAKAVVYGCIGVLTLTNLSGAHTPNGSEGNESPQGAFLLLGGIPEVGRSILIVMAVGLAMYIVWR